MFILSLQWVDAQNSPPLSRGLRPDEKRSSFFAEQAAADAPCPEADQGTHRRDQRMSLCWNLARLRATLAETQTTKERVPVLSFLGLGFTIVATISLDGGTQMTNPPGPYPFVSDVSPGFRTDKLKERTWVAIVRVQYVYSEPSGMGGDYLAFDVVRVLRGPESSRVGVGGHSWTSHATKGDLYLASLSRDSTFVDKTFPPYWGVSQLSTLW